MNNRLATNMSLTEEDIVSADQIDGAEDETDIERQYLDPSRWWFASTACPLLAGTFGPMANAFNVCALGSYWREVTAADGDKLEAPSIPDPHWLIAVNAVSLACSLTANACLLYNMTDKARFDIAQPVIIVGFFIASVLLIGLVGAASTVSFLGLDPSHARSQAYYYAVWAAAIYMILTGLMTLTAWGALRRKYAPRFHLAASQRTLMLQTTSFMLYLLGGALVFAHAEHWPYLDAVYWADFTLLTVGLGAPLVPTTVLGRALLMPYAAAGIVLLGLIVASIRSSLLDAGSAKFRARTVEKLRARAHSYPRSRAADRPPGPGAAVLHDMPARTYPSTHSRRGPGMHSSSSSSSDGDTSTRHRRASFALMRAVQRRAAAHHTRATLALATCTAAALWLGGAAAFAAAEHWSFFEALYFAHTSLLTIGYGDVAPARPAGRALFVLWSLLAVPCLTVLVAGAAEGLGGVFAVSLAHLQTRRWCCPRASGRRAPATPGMDNDDDDSDDGNPSADADADSAHDFSRTLHARLSPAERATARAAFAPASAHRAFYVWLLAREAACLVAATSDAAAQHHAQSSPRALSYDEWAYFLALAGHDDRRPRLRGDERLRQRRRLRLHVQDRLGSLHPHSDPNPDPDSRPGRRRGQSPGVTGGHAGAGGAGAGAGAAMALGHVPLDADGRVGASWSWAGLRSPLVRARGLDGERVYVAGLLLGVLRSELVRRRCGAGGREGDRGGRGDDVEGVRDGDGDVDVPVRVWMLGCE